MRSLAAGCPDPHGVSDQGGTPLEEVFAAGVLLFLPGSDSSPECSRAEGTGGAADPPGDSGRLGGFRHRPPPAGVYGGFTGTSVPMTLRGSSIESGHLAAPSVAEAWDGSPSGEPIAIVGMACRFPGAPDLAAYWRLLEGGVNAVTEGVPGSGVGRVGELYPDAEVQSEACRFGAFIEGIDLFGRRVLPTHLAGGGATPGPSAAVDVGDQLAGPWKTRAWTRNE